MSLNLAVLMRKRYSALICMQAEEVQHSLYVAAVTTKQLESCLHVLRHSCEYCSGWILHVVTLVPLQCVLGRGICVHVSSDAHAYPLHE